MDVIGGWGPERGPKWVTDTMNKYCGPLSSFFQVGFEEKNKESFWGNNPFSFNVPRIGLEEDDQPNVWERFYHAIILLNLFEGLLTSHSALLS